MARFDRIPADDLPLDEEVEKMFQGIQPSIDRRRGQSLVVLPIDKPINISKRDAVKGLVAVGKEEPKVSGITVERIRGVVTSPEMRSKVLDGGCDGIHRSPL